MKKQWPLWKEWIRKNGVYKLVSFFVAFAIWITTLHGRKDTILERNMDVEFITSPGLIAMPMEGRRLSVRVVGPRTQLKKFSQGGRVLTVQLRDVQEGIKTIDLLESDVQLPIGVRMHSVKPQKMRVDIKMIK